MESQTRVMNLLLVICFITLPISIVLTGYFIYQYQDIAHLKSKLISKNELQAQLLNAQPLEKTLFPHLVDDIGFVLNPHMKRSAFKAHKDDIYPVNSLGLRGQEIRRKVHGVTRVLIVGDSMVFGWKLREQDRLSSILNKFSSRISGDKKVEFITIALPGWNVKSERAFLESHLGLLDPDLVVWLTIPNDIEDTAGVIPPGLLANWASPQVKEQSPFGGLSGLHLRSGSFMPTIADRRKENIELISDFQSTYNIPVVLIASPNLLEYTQTELFDGQWIRLPGKYLRDTRWGISVSDGHPTPWANHVVSVGILSKLVRSGFIGNIDFNEEEMTIAKDFKALEAVKPNAEHMKAVFSAALNKIPTIYQRDDVSWRDSVLYGVSPQGNMAKTGMLFLRDTDKSSRLIVSIEPPANMKKYPGTAEFIVRNRGREEAKTTVKIDSEHINAKLELPIEEGDSPVYEISWKYDYLQCYGPSSCYAGKLITAKFE